MRLARKLEVLALFSLLAAQTTWANPNAGVVQGQASPYICITDAQYEQVSQLLEASRPSGKAAGPAQMTVELSPPLHEPWVRYVNNYLDLDPGSGIQDYHCGNAAYDGHNGIDYRIVNFHNMETDIPILAAADGEVVATQDGEFDRRTEIVDGTPANYVIVRHEDGSDGWYWHMRTGTVAVTVGQQVTTGDTLGSVGSSGLSDGPHLHFEIRDPIGNVRDPFNGSCQSEPTLWVSQDPYVRDLPFEVVDEGLTVIEPIGLVNIERAPDARFVPLGDTLFSRVEGNFVSGDQIAWELYFEGEFYTNNVWTPDASPYRWTYYWVWWILPDDDELQGSWEMRVKRNGTEIASQPFEYYRDADLIPADHFGRAVFDEPLPRVYGVNEMISLSGRLAHSRQDRLWMQLDPVTGGAPTVSLVDPMPGVRSFGRNFVIPEPGDFALNIWAWSLDQLDWVWLGAHEPITVETTAAPISSLPVTFFGGLVTDTPTPLHYKATKTFTLTGTVDERYSNLVMQIAGTPVAFGSIQDGRFRLSGAPLSTHAGTQVFSLLADIDGEQLVVGTFRGTVSFAGRRETFVITTGPAAIDGLPDAFALHQNRPNPFNPSTLIEVALPHATVGNLTIYNALGQKVDQLLDGPIEAGVHKFQWDAGSHSTGVFFYRFTAPGLQQTRRMLLVR